MLSVLFRKLRLVFDKCNENCAGMDPIPPEVRYGDAFSTLKKKKKITARIKTQFMTVENRILKRRGFFLVPENKM